MSVILPHPEHVALGGIMAGEGERMPFPRCQGGTVLGALL